MLQKPSIKVEVDPFQTASRRGFIGLIKITQIPKGDPPEWVRQAWVGLVLPCDPICGFKRKGTEKGVLTGEIEEPHRICSVPQSEAITILGDHNPRAFAWWLEQGYPKEDEDENCFGFDETEFEIIKGVTQQIIREGGSLDGDGDK